MLDATQSNAFPPIDTPAPFEQSRVKSLRSLILAEGLQLHQYSNECDHVRYEEDRWHTFSLYIQGGYQTYRTDEQSARGAPGLFCLMPSGSYSSWNVGQAQQFMHIYFSDIYIKRLALQNFDVDPRAVVLPHLTFHHSESLNALCKYSILNWNWSSIDNEMTLQHNLQTLLLNLLLSIKIKKIAVQTSFKAGLSPTTQKRLKAFINDNLHRQIMLSELAKVSEMSEYHFCRMFKLSFAETPQNYIARLKVEKLQQRLQSEKSLNPCSLAQLAFDYGFSSQSHMGRVFKHHTGLSPGQFAKTQ